MKHFVRLAVLVITILVIVLAIKLGESPERPTDVIYHTYQVKQGDNLWTIAEKANKFTMSTDEYVRWLKKLNEVYTDHLDINQSLMLVYPAIETLPVVDH